MPQIIPAIAAFVGYAVQTVAFAGAYWLAYYATEAAIFYGISRALTPKSSLGSIRAQATEVNVRDPAAPRSIAYGRRKLSGVLYPVGTSGANNDYLHMLLLVAGHECHELGDIYFNDEIVPLDGSGNATGRYAGFVRIKKHLGTYNQTVDTDLQTDLGATYWPNAMKLGGIAYFYIRLKHSADLYGGGMPEFYCMVKGRKIWDPRDGAQSATDPTTWTYSANAALVLLDWLRGVPMRSTVVGTPVVRNFGLRALDAEIDAASVIEAANICDEGVTLGTTVTAGAFVVGRRYIIATVGTTDFTAIGALANIVGIGFGATGAGTGTGTADDVESRYEAHGILPTNTLAGDGIDAIKSAMVGDCVYISGLWTIRAGAYRTPTVTITDSDLRGALMGVQIKPARRELVNGVKGVYISETNNWLPSDFPPVTNGTYYTQDGERLWRDIELPFTVSNATAQRIAKILLERSRQTIAFTAKCKLTAMQNQVTDVLSLTHARFGWSAKTFEVQTFAFVVENDSGAPYLAVDLGLRETASGVFDWAAGEETTVDLAPNTNLPGAFSVAAVSGLTLLTDSTTVIVQPDGTIQPSIKVSWTVAADIHVTSGGWAEIEYKKTTDSNYTVWGQVRGDQTFDFITNVKIGVAYDVRVRFRNNIDVAGAYSTATSAAVVGDTVTPNPATSLVATAKPGFIDLNWQPSTSNAVNEYAVYRSTTSAVAGFSLLANTANSQFEDDAVTAGTNYWYYVVAVSRSENSSAATSVAGPVTALIAPAGAAPSNPTAPAQPGSPTVGTYDATDGSVFAFVTLEVYALPAGAVWQNLLYRRTGSGDWLIGAQLKNTGTVTMRLDDLSPGVGYDIAVQAWNGAGGSAVVAGTSFTAATKTNAPGVPTGTSLTAPTGAGVLPSYVNGVLQFGSLLAWTNPSNSDLDHVEIKATATNSDGAVDYSWYFGSGNNALAVVPAVPSMGQSIALYSAAAGAGFVRIRSVNVSGVASAWVSVGNANVAAGYPAGDMSQQNKASVNIDGGTVDGVTSLDATTAVKVASTEVVRTRKAAVAAAGTGYNTGIVGSDFAGADTISLAALATHLNAVDTALNDHGARINDIRARMKASGGHGLIDD